VASNPNFDSSPLKTLDPCQLFDQPEVNSMSSNRHLEKQIRTDIEGLHGNSAVNFQLPEAIFSEQELGADLYASIPAVAPKKHSFDFLHQRQKLRQISETRLVELSEQLYKLAEEVRYYDPRMAAALDDACEATAEAIMMLDED
jgi:hypothetical protein